MKKPAELFSLQGKIAVVIGGTGELCGTIAEGFAAAGATVAIDRASSKGVLPAKTASRTVSRLAAQVHKLG